MAIGLVLGYANSGLEAIYSSILSMKDLLLYRDIFKNLLLKLNGLDNNDYLYPNQTLILPKEGVSLYLTKNNDTINSIANDLGMSIMELVDNNDNIYLRENQIIVF